jgi:predicted DNA repair protein MutK
VNRWAGEFLAAEVLASVVVGVLIALWVYGIVAVMMLWTDGHPFFVVVGIWMVFLYIDATTA